MLSGAKSLKLAVLTIIALGFVTTACGGSPSAPDPIDTQQTTAETPPGPPPDPAPAPAPPPAPPGPPPNPAPEPEDVRTGSWTVTAISDERLGSIARPSSRWPFTLQGERITLGPFSGTLAELTGGPPTWGSAFSATIDGSTLTLRVTTFWGTGTITGTLE